MIFVRMLYLNFVSILRKVLGFMAHFLLNNLIVAIKSNITGEKKIYIYFFIEMFPLCWIILYIKIDSNQMANCSRGSLVLIGIIAFKYTHLKMLLYCDQLLYSSILIVNPRIINQTKHLKLIEKDGLKTWALSLWNI